MKRLIFLSLLVLSLSACDRTPDIQESVEKVDEAELQRIADLQQQLSEQLKQAQSGLNHWRNLVITAEITQSDLAQEQSVKLMKFTSLDISEMDEEDLLEASQAISPVLLDLKLNTSLIQKWLSAKREAIKLQSQYAYELKANDLQIDNFSESKWKQSFEFEQNEEFLNAYQVYLGLNGEYTRKIQQFGGALASRMRAKEQQSIWQRIAPKANWLKKRDQRAQQDYFQGMASLSEFQFEQARLTFNSATEAWAKIYESGLLGISSPKMVSIKGGSFVMGDTVGNGDSDEKPIYKAQVTDFKMSQHEITFEQYDNYAKAEGLVLPDDNGWGRGKHPVINISWIEASNFANWLSEKSGKYYRLPTEEEWEYAAKANTDDPFSLGSNVGNLANCEGCYRWDNTQSTPVGRFPENNFGLKDMQGNVWEWTNDCYQVSYGKRDSIKDSCQDKSVRGGSWYDLPTQLRASNRSKAPLEDRSNRIGFRLVEVKPDQSQIVQE